MPYQVVIFGSGSRGNATLVAGPRSRILIDMGFTQRRLTAGLADCGLEPCDLDALFVTHTHGDHVRRTSLTFCIRHGVPVVAPRETLDVLRRRFRGAIERLDRGGLLRELPPKGLDVRGMDVRPFEVPHDAEGISLGYHVTWDDGDGRPVRLAMATDLGHVPPELLGVLGRAEILVLESNHDPTMLAESGRPDYLIERISGGHGHLANRQAAETVEQLINRNGPGTIRRLVLAHLSQECNAPDEALATMQHSLAHLGDAAPALSAASQDEPLTVA